MTVYKPQQMPDGSWCVEISHYPERRSVEHHRFDTEGEARLFYENMDLGGLDLMEENARLRAENEQLRERLRLNGIQEPKMEGSEMSWIQTYTGGVFDMHTFGPENINISDIAHALSNICRFTGHCTNFYSVAEHSALTMIALRDEVGIANKTVLQWALLHDASEAYLCDIARPFKHLVGDDYRALDRRINQAIQEAFDVYPDADEREIVKAADLRMLATEREQIMSWCHRPWESIKNTPRFGVKIRCHDPLTARGLFLHEFHSLFRVQQPEGAE